MLQSLSYKYVKIDDKLKSKFLTVDGDAPKTYAAFPAASTSSKSTPELCECGESLCTNCKEWDLLIRYQNNKLVVLYVYFYPFYHTMVVRSYECNDVEGWMPLHYLMST